MNWAHVCNFADRVTTNKLQNKGPTQGVVYDLLARLNGQTSAIRCEAAK